MLSINNKLNIIDKRLNLLKDKNNKMVLEYITDLDNKNNHLWFILKVVDKNNNILYQKEILDNKPSKYICEILNKYNCDIDYEFYDIVNNQKIKLF